MATRRIPLSWLVASTVVALLAAGVFVLVAAGNDDGDDEATPQNDGTLELVPEEELPGSPGEVVLGSLTSDDEQVLGDYLGSKPVVVNFFGSWCQPCLEEMPAFERVHQSLGDQVNFVGLAFSDTDENALETVERTGVTYPTFNDTDGGAFAFFEGTQMPTTVFLDANGTILATSDKELSEEKLRSLIDEHFGIAG